MSKPEYTVYFRGFPENVDNEELESVFANYGNVIKCFVHKNRLYGMVEFEELSSCTEAIRDLNGKLPMNLYLNMAKSSGEKSYPISSNENKRFSMQKPNNNVDVDNVVYEEQVFYIDEYNTKINVLIDPDTEIVYVPIQYAPNVRMIVRKVPVSVPIQTNGTVIDDDTASNSSITFNRKIHSKEPLSLNISVERKNTDFEQPSSSSYTTKNQKYGNRNAFYKNDDQKSNSSFENRSNDASNDFAGRANDQKPNRSFENRSKDFSGDQKPNYGMKSFENRSNDQRQNFGSKTNDVSRRSNDVSGRPNDFANNKDGQKFNNRRFNNSYQSSGAGDENPRVNKKFGEPKFGPEKVREQQKREFHKPTVPQKDEGDWNAPTPIKEETNSTEIPSQPSTSTYITKKSSFRKSMENKISYKTFELPKNIYTLVQVEHTESDSLGWVKIYDKYDDFEILSNKIMQAVGGLKVIKPVVGKLCLAKEEIWFRAIVLTVSPKITVRFIDYGNESEINEELLELSPEFEEIPAYAICIKLANGAPCKMENNKHIKVKPTKIQDNIVEVHVENGIYEEKLTSSPVSVSNHNSLISCQESMTKRLIPKANGQLTMTLKLSNNKGIAFLFVEEIADDLVTLDTITANEPYTPKIGDLGAAEHDKWNRAFVMGVKDGFKVAFIDYAIVKTVPVVRKLSDSFKNIPQFSCEFTAKNMDGIELESNYPYKIIKVVNNVVYCKLSVDDEDRDISFTLWKPDIEEEFTDSPSSETSVSIQQTEMKFCPPNLELKNGDEVKVIEENNGFIYVRTKECSDVLKKIEKYAADHIAKAPKLASVPVVGDYVAGQYENNWYRAVVKEVNQTNVKIIYIDYGNEEVKPFFSLKQLDEQSCKEPCTLIKIKLKSLIDKMFLPKHRLFLENLCEGNEKFIVSFEGSIDNGVELSTNDGKKISDELAKLDSEFRKETYMKVKVPGFNDKRQMRFKTKELTVGKGTIRYLSNVDFEDNSICVSVDNLNLLNKVHFELLQQMTKYVNHFVPYDSYKPILEEVVLVKNEDKWYRALIIEVESDEYRAFFLDYGFNLIKSPSEMRKMPKEFLTEDVPVLGNFATISALPSRPTPEMIDLLENFFVINETYSVEVLEKDLDTGSYPIVFPEILRIFQDANLI